MANDSLRRLPSPRALILLPSLLWVLCAAPQAQGANNCPWLNEATASGLLGGDAVGMFTAANGRQPAVCTFTEQTEQGQRILRVTVEVAASPQARLADEERACGTNRSPLHAIGNEAIFCEEKGRRERLSDRAVGRVRDQIFTITIGTSVKDDKVLTRDVLSAKIYTASEEVAGSLF
jgi:hypothetical protein